MKVAGNREGKSRRGKNMEQRCTATVHRERGEALSRLLIQFRPTACTVKKAAQNSDVDNGG